MCERACAAYAHVWMTAGHLPAAAARAMEFHECPSRPVLSLNALSMRGLQVRPRDGGGRPTPFRERGPFRLSGFSPRPSERARNATNGCHCSPFAVSVCAPLARRSERVRFSHTVRPASDSSFKLRAPCCREIARGMRGCRKLCRRRRIHL